MKIKFDKMIKVFFVVSMLFSQLYSPLTVFAEVATEVIQTNEELEDTNQVNTDASEDTNQDINNNTDIKEDIVTDDSTISDNEQQEEDTEEEKDSEDSTENDNLDEEITQPGKENLININISENIKYNEETKMYTLTNLDNLNVIFTPVISDSTGTVELVFNDTIYTIDDEFSIDFSTLESGTYNLTFNLYEEEKIIDSITIVIDYKFNVVLDKYLTDNNDKGMIFDSEKGTITGLYGSTTNNVTTIKDIHDEINKILGSSDISTETTSIYTGLNVVVTYMEETYEYQVVALGDVDTGYVTDSDIKTIIDFSLDNTNLDDLSILASDVNQDGKTDILDITNIIKAISTDNFEVIDTNSDSYSINLNSDDYVRENDKITLNLDISGFNGGSINGIEGIINYDDSMLNLTGVNCNQFNFGTLNDNNNKFAFAGFNSIDSDNTIITFTFKAINTGNTTVSISNLKLSSNGLLLTTINDNTSDDIVIDNALSNDNNISNISVSNGTLNKEINNDDTYYIINVDSNATNITLNGILSSSKANSQGFGTYSLTGTHTVITVAVTAEDGSIKTYTFEVVKEIPKESSNDSKVVTTTLKNVMYSNNSYLEDLIIDGYEIEFEKNTYEYSITVDSSVDHLDLTPLLANSNATYAVYGNNDFKEGENIVTIIVTAEDGSTSTYTITVDKESDKSETNIKTQNEEKEETGNNVAKTIIIIVIILIIIGIVYLIFKDDDDDDNNEEYNPKNNSSHKKENRKKK